MLKTSRHFLFLAIRPLGRIGNAWDVVQVIGLLVGLSGIAAGLSVRIGFWPTGAIVGLISVCVLLFWAGYRLQRDLDNRDRVQFDCSARLEKAQPISVNNRAFLDNYVLWISVQNNGPTSEFHARVPQVIGTPPEWGEPYEVIHPSWEQSPAAAMLIPGYGGKRRLILANIACSPRAFWFYTSQFGAQEAGNQFLISELVPDDQAVEIDFTVEIINTGAKDQIVHRRALITIPSEGAPEFTWSSLHSP
jgi:hypothetical protein